MSEIPKQPFNVLVHDADKILHQEVIMSASSQAAERSVLQGLGDTYDPNTVVVVVRPF